MRLLIAYISFPEPDTSAGALRLLEIVHILRSAGLSVTFLAQRANDSRYRGALEQLDVECVADDTEGLTASADRFQSFLKAHDFDLAVFGRFFVYEAYAGFFRTFLPRCRLILDTEDLHFVRLRRLAELTGDSVVLRQAQYSRRHELAAVRDADQVWVVTEVERQVLLGEASCAATTIRVVPTIHRVSPHIPDFTQREGIIFLGGYGHRPNVDAVQFFMTRVLPPLRAMLPRVRVTIAGSQPPTEFQEYPKLDAGVTVTGFVPNHRALLCSHRVGIAPLRAGAGMKGKIGEYFACGLPCVTTSIGAEGMDLRPDADVLLADDPTEFARAIALVYGDAALWNSLSQAGIAYVRQRVTPEAVTPAILDACRSCVEGERRAKHRRTVAKILAALFNPARWWQLGSRCISVLRHGGLRELRLRWKVWTNKA